VRLAQEIESETHPQGVLFRAGRIGADLAIAGEYRTDERTLNERDVLVGGLLLQATVPDNPAQANPLGPSNTGRQGRQPMGAAAPLITKQCQKINDLFGSSTESIQTGLLGFPAKQSRQDMRRDGNLPKRSKNCDFTKETGRLTLVFATGFGSLPPRRTSKGNRLEKRTNRHNRRNPRRTTGVHSGGPANLDIRSNTNHR
jgi:hypothetical protein